MDIPDLPLDIRFPLLGPEQEAAALAIRNAAMRPHVEPYWGWDDAVQTEIYHRGFGERPVFGIERAGEIIGTISLEVTGDHLRLNDFYLLPDWHGKGTGSAILRHCLAQADAAALPIRLRYLAWNPVASLYCRNGFVETGRTETHVYMERLPAPPAEIQPVASPQHPPRLD
jgi:GNAT superfamily N-acetyltransferase